MEKKKLIKYIIAIFIFVVIVTTITILVLSKDKKEALSISCDTKDKELICTLKGNSSYEISALSALITVSGGTLTSVNPDPVWEGDGENGKIDFYTDINKINKFNVATFNISLEENNTNKVKIDISNIEYFDKEYMEHSIEGITEEIRVK